MSSSTRTCCSWTSSTSSRPTPWRPRTSTCRPGPSARFGRGAGSTTPGGLTDIGHAGGGFVFDNERPRHGVWLEPFALADRPVTNGEWLAFIEDGGYRRPELWLSDGWAALQAADATAPLY
ncbi:MAG: SUMF1/EgtB/PvdO family nonheme iron enzyme [Acidimicrobiales bacterium]